MRVLFLAWRDLSHPRAGGSEVVVDRWATGLMARGHEVALVCGGPTGPRPYPVTSTAGTYGQYLMTPATCLRRFRDWDAVVDVSNGIPYFSPLWRRGPKVCVVHHVHGQQWFEYFPRPVAVVGDLVERRVVPAVYRNTHFVGISRSTCQDLQHLGVPAPRVHLVENGLDDGVLSARTGTKATEPLFVALGRLAPNKRLDLLLDVWPEVRATTGGTLVIAGDGPEAVRLRERAPAGVEFPGRLSEAAKIDLLARAWLLVHPAPREGWGLVILEAAVAGTPAVGFDVAGVRDTVADGETGLLAADRSGFVSAWVGLATDHSRRRAMGERARERARRFTWSRTIDSFEATLAAAAADAA